jgi:hypothetical protein
MEFLFVTTDSLMPYLLTLMTLLVRLHKTMKSLFSRSRVVGYLPSHSLFLETSKTPVFATVLVPYTILSQWRCMTASPVDGNNTVNRCDTILKHKATTNYMVVETKLWAWLTLKASSRYSPEPTSGPHNLFLLRSLIMLYSHLFLDLPTWYF